MQKVNILGAVVAAAAMSLISVAAQADGTKPVADPVAASSDSLTLPQYSPPLNPPQAQWALPANEPAELQLDKTAAVLNELLSVGNNMQLSPSTHSDIDVPLPDGAQRPKGAYLNLKVNF